jgi:diaminopropionate ammonia-lyase
VRGHPGGPPALPWYANPPARSWTCPPPRSPRAFHRQLPGYAPTPLTEVPALAAGLRVGRVFVKDESSRLGLPAFKALGASWAVHQILVSGTGAARAPLSIAALRALAAARPGLVFVTATDGNHGRAVARVAALVGAAARVFVPAVTTPAAAAAIAAEGAEVTTVAGAHDDAVAAAARWATGRPGAVLVQDTAWPGYEQVPGWIVEGYSTLFAELDAQLAGAGAGPAALVSVPVGVGSLAQAAVVHYRSRPPGTGPATALLSVEPDTAACVLASLQAGHRVSVPTADTIMAGLNCGTVSTIAWPYLAAGLDAAVAVSDVMTRRAASDLASAGISAGPSGASSLAGARAAVTGPGSPGRRAELAVGPAATVVLLSTEAAAP